REACAARIRAVAAAWAVGWAAPHEVDAVGVVEATRRAMQRALAGLGLTPEHLLLDHLRLPAVAVPQWARAKADAHWASVAAASILAKVARDAYMRAVSPAFPGFAFGRHKGYGTALHRAALLRFGPTPLHRRSFRPVAQQAAAEAALGVP
ncbi:MAG: ribonuclease HII, partial [Chloroflexi bacterium]|nr:ribonuclease HII [Chloroflexota bacterium]